MSYKQNASANRDALFGSAASGSKKKKKASTSNKSNRDSLFGSAATNNDSKPRKSSSSRPAAVTSSTGYQYGGSKKKTPISTGLKGEAKIAKMKEAEEFTAKAKKCMQKGVFSNPDPLAASSYYKRAADAYKLCGEARLERFHRMNSADCQCRVGAWATAAAEYTRAAELVEVAEDEKLETKREIGRKLHLSAADAFRNMNDTGKAAASKVQAALALMWGEESRMLTKVTLEALEEAVEDHVPDPLNPYARYRQTGSSAYVDPETDETAIDPSPETLELAKQHIVTRPYAHESVQNVLYLLVSYGEYASALYAAGAVTTLLSEGGVSTISLSRAFVAETILTLAMGDPIAAEENFMNRHVQKSSYLTSRECKLSEDLFRAVKTRDSEALEEARSKEGSNRAAIGNLNECLRELVGMIRLSGVARMGAPESSKKKPKEKKKKSSTKKSSSTKKLPETKILPESQGPSLEELSSMKTGYEKDVEESEAIDTNALQDELDAIDFGDDDESDFSDDDIDLR